MNHFDYHDGELCAESVPLRAIAENVGTPFYCYSTATLRRHVAVLREALADLPPSTICFAVKANGTLGVLATLAREGLGADVVSGGELRRALAAGIAAERIVYSGVGKTDAELAEALDAGILQINVESEPELHALDRIAREKGVKAPVALRVNPDVAAETHDKIATGRKEDKFGIEWTTAHRVYQQARDMPGIDVQGAAVHIGSQLMDLTPFRAAFSRVRDLVAMLAADGVPLKRLDLGGGLGVPYADDASPDPRDYAAVVRETLGDLGLELVFEPGRLIAANAGVLVSRVVRVKEGATRTFVVLDAGMNDLMRPALYDAEHEIRMVTAPDPTAEGQACDVVGPICEPGDTFSRQRWLPPVFENDLVAFMTAGAYGASMANTYNARPLPAEVLVEDDDFAVIRPRLDLEPVITGETLPPWMG